MSNTYDADHRWQNMCAMLDRLGLDASVLAHGRLASDLRSAVTSCLHCSADQHCSEWLVRAPETLEKAPQFCPNAELFATVREAIERGADDKIP
jgi:uncharacterized protein DUF6455